MDNNKTGEEKILLSNVHLYRSNIRSLSRLRPQVELEFGPIGTSGAVSFTYKGDTSAYQEDIAELSYDLQALNSAIVMNCFALFEASFEQLLLSYVSTDNLTGVQEKLVLRHIETVINLSSEARYAEEFHFLSEMKIKEFFTEEENDAYHIIKTFYVLRHLLAHGSVTKHEFLPGKREGKINLNLDDQKFQELVALLKNRLQIPVLRESLNLSLLMQINEVASFLGIAVHKVTQKMLRGRGRVVRYMKPPSGLQQ